MIKQIAKQILEKRGKSYVIECNYPDFLEILVNKSGIKLTKSILDISWETIVIMKKTNIWKNRHHMNLAVHSSFFVNEKKLDKFIGIIEFTIEKNRKISYIKKIWDYLRTFCYCFYPKIKI